jgi:hypothetical protein
MFRFALWTFAAWTVNPRNSFGVLVLKAAPEKVLLIRRIKTCTIYVTMTVKRPPYA